MEKEEFEDFLYSADEFRVDIDSDLILFNGTECVLYLTTDDMLYIDSGEGRIQIPMKFNKDKISYAYNRNLCNIVTVKGLKISIAIN